MNSMHGQRQSARKANDEDISEFLFADRLAKCNPCTSTLASQLDTRGYVLVRGFLDNPLLSVTYRYLRMKHHIGTTDAGANAAAETLYGDALMETILELARPAMERITGRTLWPTFAYYRLYNNGDVLKAHRDRPECEISATLSLGQDLDEIRKSKPDYAWPIFMDGHPVVCLPGDMAVYKGCEVKHWREPFEGACQAQLFMFFVDQTSPKANMLRFDGRSKLGMPPVDRISRQALLAFSHAQQEAIVDLQRQAQAIRARHGLGK